MVARNTTIRGIPAIMCWQGSGCWPIIHLEFHTMSVIRMGSSTKYADGWSHVFGGGKQGQGSARGKKSAGPAKAAKKAAAKRASGKKSPVKKSAKRR